jgi:hypothetical protein
MNEKGEKKRKVRGRNRNGLNGKRNSQTKLYFVSF